MYDGPAILIRIPPSRLPYLGYSRDVCKVKEGQSLVKRAPDISTSELRALLSRRCEHVVKPRQPTSDDQVEQRVLEGRPQTKPCEPESTGKKRRHAVIPDFAFQVEKLKVWVAKRSYFPWGKSQDSEERSLAHFVCRVRAARASGLLQQSQADIVEVIVVTCRSTLVLVCARIQMLTRKNRKTQRAIFCVLSKYCFLMGRRNEDPTKRPPCRSACMVQCGVH